MMRITWVISAFFIFLGIAAHAQSTHYLRCLSVNVLADVTLTWEEPITAPEFSSYRIYHAEISNPSVFQELAYIDVFNTTSYVHTGGSAADMINLYYIETELTGGGSIFSDTLRTLFLEADDNGEGEVILSWNNMHGPPLPSASNNFNVFREYPMGNWEHVGSTNENTYIHEISVCHDSLSFQVVVQDDYGCSSASNIMGGFYEDVNKPPMPSIDSVSIGFSDQEIIIGWQASPAPDAIAYIIYRDIDNSFIPIDTVWGRFNTSYRDIAVLPCNESQSYAMATLDSCENKSLGTFFTPHQSIVLEEIIFNPCESSNALSWSAYINMDPPLLGYEIYASIENGPYQFAGSTAASETTFIHEGLDVGNHYSYYVRAFNVADHSSSSCIKQVFAFDYAKPGYHYLANVSVENNQQMEVTTYVDISATIESIKIYRQGPSDTVFEEITEIAPVTTDIISYEDQAVNIHQGSYQYRFSLIDSCGNETLNTNTIPSIFLQGNIMNKDEIFLEWNDFSGWDGSIESYEVYRVNEGVIESLPIASVPEGTTEIIVEITESSTTVSSFDFIVTAVEAGDNSFGFEEISYSNILQLQGTPSIYMPNAFRPQGVNSVFKPVGNYIDQSNYVFQIFDRWGRLVFETHNFSEGWDGSYNGEPMPVGVFIYVLNYQVPDGSIASQKGSFVLIR